MWIAATSGCGADSDKVALGDGSALLFRATERRFNDDTPLAERGSLRVLTVYDRSNFYVENGQPRGYEYELMQQFEAFLAKRAAKRGASPRLVFIPAELDRLIPMLEDGRGDVIAANLTVTRDRARRVAFSLPYLEDVDEIVVARSGAPPLEDVQDLSGRQVVVLRGSSFAEHLERFNFRLAGQGRRPVRVVQAETALDQVDLFEMANDGIIDYTIADNHVARLWQSAFPKIVVRDDLAVHSGGSIAWAVQDDDDVLKEALDAFVREHGPGRYLGNMMFSRYFERREPLADPADQLFFARAARLEPYFREYSAAYGFDWLLMMAVGFQESRLSQRKRSHAGAVGVMQLRPATARSMGVKNYRTARANILAGIRYMDHLREEYFADPQLAPSARLDFTLAAYNAGPARVQGMRERAEEMGLDPNVWFGNVERAAQLTVGAETVRYVRNVNKYYLAYRLAFDTMRARVPERLPPDELDDDDA